MDFDKKEKCIDKPTLNIFEERISFVNSSASLLVQFIESEIKIVILLEVFFSIVTVRLYISKLYNLQIEKKNMASA